LAQIGFSERAFEDFERVFEFYSGDDPDLARAQMRAIMEAIAILADHPLIGRLIKHGLRELVISRGKTGFVALHRFSPQSDFVRILRIRHQRELGYPQG
jgi:plasmid stabilization system protein ParE